MMTSRGVCPTSGIRWPLNNTESNSDSEADNLQRSRGSWLGFNVHPPIATRTHTNRYATDIAKMGRNGLMGNFQGFDAFGKVSSVENAHIIARTRAECIDNGRCQDSNTDRCSM